MRCRSRPLRLFLARQRVLVYRLPWPVIFVFVSTRLKLRRLFSKIGASGDYGGSYFLPYLVGAAKARELYFTADVISGTEAFAMGLVNKVASADVFDAESKAYAQALANLPTVAVGVYEKEFEYSAKRYARRRV